MGDHSLTMGGPFDCYRRMTFVTYVSGGYVGHARLAGQPRAVGA